MFMSTWNLTKGQFDCFQGHSLASKLLNCWISRWARLLTKRSNNKLHRFVKTCKNVSKFKWPSLNENKYLWIRQTKTREKFVISKNLKFCFKLQSGKKASFNYTLIFFFTNANIKVFNVCRMKRSWPRRRPSRTRSRGRQSWSATGRTSKSWKRLIDFSSILSILHLIVIKLCHITV